MADNFLGLHCNMKRRYDKEKINKNKQNLKKINNKSENQ